MDVRAGYRRVSLALLLKGVSLTMMGTMIMIPHFIEPLAARNRSASGTGTVQTVAAGTAAAETRAGSYRPGWMEPSGRKLPAVVAVGRIRKRQIRTEVKPSPPGGLSRNRNGPIHRTDRTAAGYYRPDRSTVVPYRSRHPATTGSGRWMDRTLPVGRNG